jgi:hypothetical protein
MANLMSSFEQQITTVTRGRRHCAGCDGRSVHVDQLALAVKDRLGMSDRQKMAPDKSNGLNYVRYK